MTSFSLPQMTAATGTGGAANCRRSPVLLGYRADVYRAQKPGQNACGS